MFMLTNKVNASRKSTHNVTLTSKDLKYFVKAIEKVVVYTEHHQNVLVDLSLTFGLFLTNGKHTLIITTMTRAYGHWSRIIW